CAGTCAGVFNQCVLLIHVIGRTWMHWPWSLSLRLVKVAQCVGVWCAVDRSSPNFGLVGAAEEHPNAVAPDDCKPRRSFGTRGNLFSIHSSIVPINVTEKTLGGH